MDKQDEIYLKRLWGIDPNEIISIAKNKLGVCIGHIGKVVVPMNLYEIEEIRDSHNFRNIPDKYVVFAIRFYEKKCTDGRFRWEFDSFCF